MRYKYERPVWVWLIFILFLVGGLSGIYHPIKIYFANAAGSESLRQPLEVMFYVRPIGFSLLVVASAIFLFLRKAVCRWLFTGLLALSILGMVYSILTGEIPEQDFSVVIGTMMFGVVFYSIIAWYSFKLLSCGYFQD